MTDARRHDLLALVLLAAVATAFFGDVLAGRGNFYMRDLSRYYYPAKQVLREIVQHGEFPYWNRYFGAGQPIAANPEHEVFYPLTWLILLPSYDLGYRLHILIHIYIGLFGMYAFLRSLELRPPAAFFGALAFGLGGIYLSYVNLLPILFCAAWLPLTCLYVRKFLLAPSLRTFALSSLFLGLQFLVAEPTTVMQTGLLLGMYALYRGWYAARDAELPWTAAIPEMLARVVFIGLISVAALLMGAAQMLPALDHVADSARSRPFDFSLVSAWSMPWAKFAEFIYPNFLGHISIDRVMWYWAGGLYPGMGSPFLFSVYGGLLVTAFAAAALFVRPRGGRFVLILFVFSALIALGGHTPLLQFLYKIHVAQSIRYPEKFILIAVFAATVLACQMLDRMLRGDQGVRDAALGFVLATTMVAAVFAVGGFTTYYGEGFTKVWGLKGGGGVRMTTISHHDWIIAAIRGLLLFGLLRLVYVIKRPIWLVLLAIFVTADLLPVVDGLNPRMPARFFLEEPAVVRQLNPDRKAYRIFHEADWYGREAIARDYFSAGGAVYWIVRNGLMPMIPAGNQVQMVIDRDYDKTALLPTLDLIDSVWDVKRYGRKDWWRPFAAMSNVWYRANYRPFPEEKKRTKGDLTKSLPISFEEIKEHYPRYYFADQVVTIRDRRDFVDKLHVPGRYPLTAAFVKAPGFVPAKGVVRGLRETANTAVIDVEVEDPSSAPSLRSGAPSPRARGEGLSAQPCRECPSPRRNGERVAEGRVRGFLIMSVTPHKYWKVTIDGARVEPVITNIGYQGVVVPAGRHRVSMRYRNDLAANAMLVSIAVTILLAAAAVWNGHKQTPSQ